MEKHKITGIDCANCALELERDIRKVPNAKEAKLTYATETLVLPENVDLDQVSKVLAREGAAFAEIPNNHSDHDHGHDHDHDHSAGSHKKELTLLAVSAVLFAAVMMMEANLPRWAELILYLIAASISGYTTFLRGLRNLFRFRFTIDTLMTIAMIGAFLIGEWREGAMVAILFGLNEYLEGYGMRRAQQSMKSLLSLAPETATLIIDGKEREVGIENLAVGDKVIVKAGEKIPSDARVYSGSSNVNEAAITGEAVPVKKREGDDVFGGAVNQDGTLILSITKVYKESSMAKIFALVEEAQSQQTPLELAIDKFARFYTPVILVLAMLVMLVPGAITGDWNLWVYQGLAILIIGCPCALVLSSPIALMAGLTRSAKIGVLVKSGVFLEQLAKLDEVVMDKTGTLTKGELSVVSTWLAPADPTINVFEIVRKMEGESHHPLALALITEAEKQGANNTLADGSVRTIAGKGLEMTTEDTSYFLGNNRLFEEATWSIDAKHAYDLMLKEGMTVAILGTKTDILAIFGIRDQLREEAKETVAALKRSGVKQVTMLTGDNAESAQLMAEKAGLYQFKANLLPEDKVAYIKEAKEKRLVAMVGDGINDSPALATAQVGIAMGQGSDSAIEVADVVLMQSHLKRLPFVVDIGHKVQRVIHWNIGIALGLKIIALLLTIPGWLTLWFAILSDMGATVLVTLISLTLLIPSKAEKELLVGKKVEE